MHILVQLIGIHTICMHQEVREFVRSLDAKSDTFEFESNESPHPGVINQMFTRNYDAWLYLRLSTDTASTVFKQWRNTIGF